MTKIIVILFVALFLFSGIYAFLISFNIIKLKFKTHEKQIRFEEKLNKNLLLLKISSIIYLITFISTLIKTNFLPNLFNKNSSIIWTQNDKEKLRNNCLEDQFKSGADSSLSREYCDCATEKMTSALSKKKIFELSKKEITQQSITRDSILKDCIDNYMNAIKDTISDN